MADLIISSLIVLLVSIPVSLTSILLGWIPLKFRSPIIRPMFRLWGWALCKILSVKVTVQGKENLIEGFKKGHLVISNHQSLIDIPVIASQTDLPFLMKKEIAKIPLIGLGAQLYGCIALDRSNLNARKDAGLRVIKQVENAVSTVTFPEGTRSKSGTPKDVIHPGLIKAAYLKKIPVLPMILRNTYEVLDYSKKPLRIKRGVNVELKILPVKDPSDYENHEKFIEATWGEIKSKF